MVTADIAMHFGQGRKVFPFGLADVEYIDRPESVELLLRLLRVFGCLCYAVGFFVADHRSKNQDAFFPAFHEASKRIPRPQSSDVGGIGFLQSTHILPMF